MMKDLNWTLSSPTNSTITIYFMKIPVSLELFILFTIMTSAIICNGFNLFATYRSPSLQTFSNVYLTAITVTDCLTGLLVLPFLIAMVWLGSEPGICQIQGVLISIFNGASFILTVAVSVERCHAVVDPFKFIRRATRRKYTIVITFSYCASIGLAITPLLGLEKYGLGRYHQISTCWLSFRVDKTNRIINTIYAFGIAGATLTILLCYIILFFIAYAKSAINTSHRSIRTSLRTIILIVGTNVVCWMPFTITMAMGVIKYWMNINNRSISSTLAQIILILTYCNVGINPIIYISTNSILRKQFRIVFNKLYRRDKIVPLEYPKQSQRSTHFQLNENINHNEVSVTNIPIRSRFKISII